MKIVIIGSGNVAYHLLTAFKKNDISVAQIFGRNDTVLREISEEFHIPYSTKYLEEAELYIISVNDSSIADVSKKISKKDCLVAHTSGSMSLNSLLGSYRKSVFYPLQTFSKEKPLNYSEIPFFINAENEKDKNALKDLASKISDKVMFADDEKRKYIHLTAVFACNFVNHLYTKSKEISDKQNIPFSYFLPLIDETTKKIHFIDPKDAQTGPAIRNDKKTVKLHELLIHDEEALKIYKTINQSIRKMYEL